MNRHGFDSWAANPSQVIPIPSPDPMTPYVPVPAPPTPTSSISSSNRLSLSTPTSLSTRSSTITTLLSTSAVLPTATASIAASATISAAIPVYTASDSTFGPSSVWAHVSHSAQIAIILFIILAIFTVIIFSFWFCCGGRARWARHSHLTSPESSSSRENLNPRAEIALRNRTDEEMRESREPEMSQMSPSVSNSSMTRTSGCQSMGTGDGPPPRYEEAVPHQHQRLAGGMAEQRASGSASEDGEMGVISDGKMPVSEMVFEDVVVDRNRSGDGMGMGMGQGQGGPGGMFGMGRRERVGDTTGHTNT